MKKIISILISTVMIISLFVACGTKEQTENTAKEKFSVVTTIFPEYDWVREILGEKANETKLTLLLDKGVDLHNYQPTADDLITLSQCDMFIYVGGESDEWVEDALKNSVNPDMIVINLLEALGDMAKEEEIVEGMQGEEEEEAEDGEEEVEYDEHVWLSLKNADFLCNIICERLCQLDSENEAVYKANFSAYSEKLSELDKKFEEEAKNASQKTVLFGDRFPFRYLVGDYGINYYAAFVGCSAETEASFETISFLADKVKELDLKYVLKIDGSDSKIAQTIISTSGKDDVEILEMNSLQSATSKDIENGTTYLSVMEKNLEVLKTAIN